MTPLRTYGEKMRKFLRLNARLATAHARSAVNQWDRGHWVSALQTLAWTRRVPLMAALVSLFPDEMVEMMLPAMDKAAESGISNFWYLSARGRAEYRETVGEIVSEMYGKPVASEISEALRTVSEEEEEEEEDEDEGPPSETDPDWAELSEMYDDGPSWEQEEAQYQAEDW